MGYITEIGLNSRFFQGKGAYQLVYHKNSGTLPLTDKRYLGERTRHSYRRYAKKKPREYEISTVVAGCSASQGRRLMSTL